jgi:hypothetical protein
MVEAVIIMNFSEHARQTILRVLIVCFCRLTLARYSLVRAVSFLMTCIFDLAFLLMTLKHLVGPYPISMSALLALTSPSLQLLFLLWQQKQQRQLARRERSGSLGPMAYHPRLHGLLLL